MLNLDDAKTIKKYDASNMLKILESFPEQCAEAAAIGANFAIPTPFKTNYSNIVFTGLGGSAIGADIIRSYVSDEARAPILVNRNYALPGFVDSESLVIAASYSGNTEETLGAYKDAKNKKARIVAITSGGELARLAGNDGFPVVKIPEGLPPRCALGYSFFPALILLSKMGLIKNRANEISETINILKSLKDKELGCSVSFANGKNVAKVIAGQIYQKYPIIYSSVDHIDCVATRWRGQLAENAKTLSSAHVFPEMNHNEIVGWENPKNILKDFVAIILRDAGDSSRISKRMDITKKIIAREKIEVIEAASSGSALLARIFSLIYTGDFVSFYLAILNECDPTPVERIDYLKKELSKA